MKSNFRIDARALLVPLLALIVFAPSGLLAPERAVGAGKALYVKIKEARMREGPSTQYQIKWILPTYYPLENLAKYEDWFATRAHDGSVGWIHEDSLAFGRAAIVTVSETTARAKPDDDSEKLFVAPKNYLFLIAEESKDGAWLKTKGAESEIGWIRKSAVWTAPE